MIDAGILQRLPQRFSSWAKHSKVRPLLCIAPLYTFDRHGICLPWLHVEVYRQQKYLPEVTFRALTFFFH